MKGREEGVSLKSKDLKCQDIECIFVGQSKAGLVNHVWQGMGGWPELWRSVAPVEQCMASRGSTCTGGSSRQT